MKKTVLFLGMLLMVVALFLTGCGGTKQAGAGSQDVVNKVSSTTADNKTSDLTSTADNSQDNQKQAASAQKVENPQVEAQKDPDNSKLAENKPAESNPVINQRSGSTNQEKGTISAAVTSPPVSVPVLAEATARQTVTMSINCQTAVDQGLSKQEKFKDIVPPDGVILAPTIIELKDGESAFDILKTITRSKKIHMEYEGSKGTPYIQGINNLYEFDGGPLSGWMFCVNKIYPNYGCGRYKLKAGDIIEWNYTCDLGKDLGQEWIK